MPIIDWPIAVLAPRDVALTKRYLTRPDQEATNGMSRSVGLTGVKMRVRLIDVPVMDASHMRGARAMIGLMEGNSNLVRFNLPDFYGLDGPFAQETLAGRLAWPLGVPFEQGGTFLGGAGFAVPFRTGTLVSAAALNAREIIIYENPSIDGGVYISVEDAIYTVTGSFNDGVPGVNRLTISPPLRRAVSQSVPVKYAAVFVGKCVTDSAGFEALEAGRFGLYSFEFLEDLTRFVSL
jgi:hypothetical protein